jgi:hypothetical protein
MKRILPVAIALAFAAFVTGCDRDNARPAGTGGTASSPSTPSSPSSPASPDQPKKSPQSPSGSGAKP